MPNYNETWDVTKPAGNRDISLGDDDIREFKRGITERLGEDHEFQNDETGNTKIGYHKKVTLIKRSEDPDAVTDCGIFYSKDVGSGAIEAFFIDEAGNITQITKRGQVARAGKFVEMFFGPIAEIPAGFYLCDGTGGRPDLRDKFIVGARQDDSGVAKTFIEGVLAQSATPVHNHGGLTGSTAITIAQMPVHNVGPILGTISYGGGAGTSQWRFDSIVQTSIGGGLGHDHTISAVTAIPPYYALAFISQHNN